MITIPRTELQLDVIFIAPAVPGMEALAFANEVGGLRAIEGVQLDIISGDQATVDRVARALRQRADVVIWSGHGEPGRLLTADGAIDGEWLATQARAGAPRAMVLAACGSSVCSDLESLLGECSHAGINVIGMPMKTADNGAMIFNKEFLRALVANADVYTAYRVAIKRLAQTNPELADGITLMPGLTNGYRFIVDRIDAQDGRFDRIEAELVAIRALLTRRR